MKSYQFKQSCGISEDKGKTVKYCSIQIIVEETGISKKQLREIINKIDWGFADFLVEECESSTENSYFRELYNKIVKEGCLDEI